MISYKKLFSLGPQKNIVQAKTMEEDRFWLFEEFWKEKLSLLERARALYCKLSQTSRSFSFSVILSVILHITILGLLVHSHSLRNSPSEKGDISLADREAFSQALSILRIEMREEAREGNDLKSVLSEKEIIRLLGEAPSLDSRFTKQERVEIFLDLLKIRLGSEESLSAAKGTPWPGRELVLGNGSRVIDSGLYPSGKTTVYKISPQFLRQVAFLRRSEKWEREGAPVVGDYVRVPAEKGHRDIPADFYFRDCPYEEMLTIGEKVFYFANGFPILEHLGDLGKKEIEMGKVFSSYPQRGFALFLIESGHLKPAVSSIAKRPLEPLILSAGEHEIILDKLMELPEEEQFNRFVSNYLERYDPAEGDLAVLTREFMQKNMGAIFIISSPFAAAFDFLEELYFNKRSQGYLERYCTEKQGTKTATEILFILGGLIDYEKRTLGFLFDAYEPALKVLTGAERRLDVFSQKAKAFVIKQIMEKVLEAMEKAGIQSEAELLRLYDDYEASLYGLIAEAEGETRDRALFALGSLYWSNGMHKEAIGVWKSIKSSYKNRTWREVQHQIECFERLSSDGPLDYSLIGSRVNAILSGERSDQDNKQLRRLIKHRKWSLRYKGQVDSKSAF